MDKTNLSRKKDQTAEMFDNISGNYDFLNHFLSAGIDILWRKKAIGKLKNHQPKTILDVATGTADLAIEALSLKPEQVTGIDISVKMLEVGKKKIATKKLESQIHLEVGDAENLPFKDESFDAVMSAFGVRNFENLEKGLQSMNRVMKKGGMVVILEFSKPKTFPISSIYKLYFKRVLPIIGKVVSNHNSAYTYLPNSVMEFPDGDDFLSIMSSCGFTDCKSQSLTLGIATIYTGKK
ncbi:MAG: bifunctional demethylmenaquinone methyltransferase/2-methoxy-6-polyprenyl-1,4-benzoquinol methylase UbiE [Bacteroidetes bacterium]|nr:MAG: bifunctional demethylmenaquinone methyltransferase/2-methoxy-6-polyprenyl-1,4-benzoquinol methylase UbiE [Bacteroidota bacterium]